MYISKKLKKILLGTVLATAGIGTIAGVAINLSNTTTSSTSSSHVIQTIVPTSIADGYSMSIETMSAADSTSTTYKATIQSNDKKEGKIYFVNEKGEWVNEITFTPGQTLKVRAEMNKGYETYTVRDLKVYGKDENHFVPSKNVDNSPYDFEIAMPTVEDTIGMDGSSWLYGEGIDIKVVPTFIQHSIATGDKEVNWTHGAYFNDINGYVFNMTQDDSWSNVWTNLYSTAGVETSKDNPINFYVYLNGHKLTMDQENVELDIPSGWALHFYNNKFDSVDKTFGYGQLYVPTNSSSTLTFGGALHLGNSVEYNMVPQQKGVKFLNINDKSWIGNQINDPTQK